MTMATETLVDRAVRHVQAHIRANDLKVGDALPGEGSFASELGVSRAVMREAFGALAALRLLDVGNGRRARVGAIDGSVMGTSISHAVATAQVSTAQVWDVRRTLELRTVELAALNRTHEEASEIERLASEMADSLDDPDRLIRTDIALHQAIAVASRNPLYQQIIRSFEPLMREAVPAAWATRRTDDQRAAILDVHLGLARAIAAGDGDKAKALVDAHFDASIADLFS